MSAAKMAFSRNAKVDYANWNCDAMYPPPKEADLGLPKWLGGITRMAKKGFEIYNQVKSLIPGGTTAGAGPVPGSGASMAMEEVTELIGFKEIEGLGKQLKEQLDQNDADAVDAMQRRREIHRQALAMCESDKAKFLAQIEEVKGTIRMLERPIDWKPLNEPS